MVRDIRVCLDLNVWFRQLLNEKKGKSGTPSQRIVEIVSSGRCATGGVQLVVSHTMLSRLETAIVRSGATKIVAEQFTMTIETIARIGPYQEPTSIVLGGGFHPTRDAVQIDYNPYDRSFAPRQIDAEDGRVLDTALAGGADMLITNNMKDFSIHSDEIVGGRVRLKTTANRRLVLVNELDGLSYLQTGLIAGIGDVLSQTELPSSLPRP
jgi:predicted nucleic acid-binding protein